MEELADGADKVAGVGRRGDSAGENCLIGDIAAAVVGAGVVLVLVDYVSGEVDAGEDALAARVGEEAGVGKFSCGGLRVASDGTGGDGCVAAELDLIVEKALEAVVSGSDEDEVSGLAASLEAEAGPGQLDEGGCAPAMAGATGDDALAVLCANDKRSFFVAGDDGDAGGVGGDAVGDTLVGRVHELVKNHVGGLDAMVEFLDVGGQCGHCDGRSETEHLDDFHKIYLSDTMKFCLSYRLLSAMHFAH